MFRLVQNETFSWPISVDIPVDGGRFETATFEATFKKISQSKIKDIQKKLGEAGFDDIGLCREVLVGWTGIVDEDGNEVPYTLGNRDTLLDIIGIPSAIIQKYFEAIRGVREKN